MSTWSDWLGSARRFIAESIVELKKVNWLRPREAVISAAVVAVLIAIFASFISVVDWGLAEVVKAVLRVFGGRS